MKYAIKNHIIFSNISDYNLLYLLHQKYSDSYFVFQTYNTNICILLRPSASTAFCIHGEVELDVKNNIYVK